MDPFSVNRLNKKQRIVFDFVVGAMKKAGITVTFCDDDDIVREFSLPGKKDLLRFSSNDAEFGRTLKDAINDRGIVAPGLADAKVKVVDVSAHGRGEDKTYGIRTAHEGEPGQFSYRLSSGVLDGKMQSAAARRLSRMRGNEDAHIAALSHIEEIIENSIDAEIHPDMDKVSGRRSPTRIAGLDRMVHRLYGAVSFNGKTYLAKTMVFKCRANDDMPYTFEVNDIKVTPLNRLFGRLMGRPVVMPKDGCLTGAQLLAGVRKAYDDKLLLNESRTLSKKITRLFLNIPSRKRYLHKAKLYGWARGNMIFITKEGVNPYTPLHEYAHLWAHAMQAKNPEGWRSVMQTLSRTPVWAKIARSTEYAGKGADDIAGEALARISAQAGLQKLEAIARRKPVQEAGEKVLEREAVKAAETFWNWTADSLFAIPVFGSIEEVSDRVLYDLCRGTDLENEQAPPGVDTMKMQQLSKRITAAFKAVLEKEAPVPEDLLKEISEEGFRRSIPNRRKLFEADMLLLASEGTAGVSLLRQKDAEYLTRQKVEEMQRYIDCCPAVFKNPPYTITDVLFENPPYKDGKPLMECERWKDGTKDFGRILSLFVVDKDGNARRFGKNEIDAENRIRFHVAETDADAFYHLDTGALGRLNPRNNEKINLRPKH